MEKVAALAAPSAPVASDDGERSRQPLDATPVKQRHGARPGVMAKEGQPYSATSGTSA